MPAGGGGIIFSGAGKNTLTLDDLPAFKGSIKGLNVGDQIILHNTGLASGNVVLAATIGKTTGGVQGLRVTESSEVTNSPLFADYFAFPITGAEADGNLTNDYFQVTKSASGADTILTLMAGGAPTKGFPVNNPVNIAVNGPAAFDKYRVTGAGIKVGVISGFIDGGFNEANAMGDIIHEIAPDANVDPKVVNSVISSVTPEGVTEIKATKITQESIAAAIRELQVEGCTIIVDDLAFLAEDDGITIEGAIHTAVASGITYITVAGNNAPLPIINANGDSNALTVAAMNILAMPNTTVGGYLTPPQIEPFSQSGVPLSGKPDITGPDGGPTTADLLLSGLSPFFGTSAAAPAVAAVAALMMQQNKDLIGRPFEVYRLLKENADSFDAPAYQIGAGLVDAYKAVTAAARFVPTPTTAPVVPGASVLVTGSTVTVAIEAGQTVDLDPLMTFFGGLIPTLILQGPGIAQISAPAIIGDLQVTAGASLVQKGGTITTDPVEIDAGGNITGFGTLTGDETINGTITASGGTLDITGNVSGRGTLTFASNAALQLEGAIAATNSLVFNGVSETLILGASARVLAPVRGLGQGDFITLAGQQVASAVFNVPTGVLAITGSNGSLFALNMVGADPRLDVRVVNGKVATSIDLGPTITAALPSVVERTQTTVVGLVTPGLSGDTLILVKTGGIGTLALGAVQADGTQTVIYTAPVTVGASVVDAVSYTVSDQHNVVFANGSASVQLDAGPTITAKDPKVVEKTQTTVVGLVSPGLSGDTLSLIKTGGIGTLALGAVQADGTQEVIYTAPSTLSASTVDAVTYTVSDQHNDVFASGAASVQLDAGPAATNPSVTVAIGQTLDLAGVKLATPGLPGDMLSVISDSATKGIATVVAGDLGYAPGAGFVHLAANATAKDTVNYAVSDQFGGIASGTLNVSVTNPAVNIFGRLRGESTIQGTAGTDIITAYGKENTIYANGGNDVVNAGAGEANVKTGSGDVVVNLSGSDNTVTGGDGWNTVAGSQGETKIILGNGNNKIIVAGDDNQITTGAGDDIITLIGRSNWIDAGAGNNTLTFQSDGSKNGRGGGGGDGDTIILHTTGTDHIFGYTTSSRDTFDLQSVLKEANISIGDSFKQLSAYLHVTNSAGDASIIFDATGKSVNGGITLAVLHGVGSSVNSLADLVSHNGFRLNSE